jgi:alpha-1,3-rhamnosyl/mannosyltransferase
LPALYTGASLLAYPSIYEGFGLPPLEAMGCGCPVLTSNASSLPEVVGDAGFTVNPLDVEQISSGLTRLLEDAGLRHDLSAKGLDRSGLFSWDECARLTLAAYQKALTTAATTTESDGRGSAVPASLSGIS